MAGSLVIFLSDGTYPRRWEATSLAVTAAALGDAVTVALSGDALRLWVAGRFDEGAPPGAAGEGVPPLSATLAEARHDLGLRVVACETAVRLAGLEPEAIRPHLDGFQPLPSLWRLAREGHALAF
jgi:peroxiredoxin family protein